MLDILRFEVPTLRDVDEGRDMLSLRSGSGLVKGATKKLWVERYDGTGEATISGPMSSDLMTQMPVGSVLSHIKTRCLMVVHSHQIKAGTDGGDPEVEVRAHELVQALEGKRIEQFAIPTFPEVNEFEEYDKDIPVGWDFGRLDLYGEFQPTLAELPKHVIYRFLESASTGGYHSRYLLTDPFHYYAFGVFMTQYAEDQLTSSVYPELARLVQLRKVGPKDTVLSAARPVMGEFDIGMSTLRNRGYARADGVDFNILIHGGADLTGDDGVRLRIGSDTISKYQALLSNKTRKVGAYVRTTYYDFFMIPDQFNLERRSTIFDSSTIYVDASSVDSDYETLGDAKFHRSYILSKAYGLGQIELVRANMGNAVIEVDISKDNTQYEFRRDFNLGDVVILERSEFLPRQEMRVVEFVESEEESRFESYPVLKPVGQYWRFNANTREEYDFPTGGGW